MAVTRTYYPDSTEDELENLKETDFAPWLKYYVTQGIANGQTFDTWLVELVNGPNYIATSYPRYCTRGYAFRIHEAGRSRATTDYGISATSGDVVYYGVLNEILEVRYPGMMNLRCILFMCDWYDPVFGRGVSVDEFGVISVHSGRRLGKYDPFIIASQANQVCYIRYPKVTARNDPWITVTSINPRGRLHGVSEHEPLQPTGNLQMVRVEPSGDAELIIDFTQFGESIVHSESEESRGEFEDDTDSLASDESSSQSA